VRAYLAQTLDVTLDLLGHAADTDAALHYFRLALRHEDRLGEALAECAAEWQLPAGEPWRVLPARPAREPLWLPAQRLQLGSAPGGNVPCNERWAHEVAVPEFEIDAQPVSWARFVEFAEDGGYDRRDCWSEVGWAWLQREGRRAPRHVEQLRGAVLVQRHGQMQRVAAGQPVLHVSRFEAEAWCRWAGRRLPTEPEWEVAALTAGSRGFAWGDVFEWVGGSARPWPDHHAGPGSLDAMPVAGPQGAPGVLRGASWITPPRCRHAKARRFAAPACDTMFSGFRSCAL
jgi:formylglycine-generating enzyme required for sulfatase activity